MNSVLLDVRPPNSEPSDRSTTFQPVTGGTEQRDGLKLMVTAYSLVWVVLLGWVLLVWLRQRFLDSRIRDLDSAIERLNKTRSYRS